MPRGGRRIGAGRKPKNKTAKLLHHPSSSPASVLPTTNDPSPVEEFDAPNDLSPEARAIWLKQAPQAFANRTLTRASAMAFERYCEIAVMERDERRSSGRGESNHRGLMKELRELEARFLLIPSGKAMPSSERTPHSAADPDDAFFGGGHGH